MTKAFKKGDVVTLITDYDRKGTVKMTPAVVYSCGTKRMVLTHDETNEELGRNYMPKADEGWPGEFVFAGRVSEEKAIEVAKFIIGREHQRLTRCLAGGHGERYDNEIRKQIDNLHEPRVVRG